MHSVALFSPDPHANTAVITHGWPESFLENYPVALELFKSGRPLNIIIPSLPGYTFSARPPLDRDFDIFDAAELINTLVAGLGIKTYVAVGGDIGSPVSTLLRAYLECRGVHGRLFRARCAHAG